jgi:hypothetical protein
MLAITDATKFTSFATSTAAATRKLLQGAQGGEVHLLELEKMQLNDVEVAKYLTRQIRVLRAAAYGGGFETLGMLLEEIYYCLCEKTENAEMPSHPQNSM